MSELGRGILLGLSICVAIVGAPLVWSGYWLEQLAVYLHDRSRTPPTRPYTEITHIPC